MSEEDFAAWLDKSQGFMLRDTLDGHVIEGEDRTAALRLSQRGLARQLAVTAATVARLEDGTNHADVSVGMLARLTHALGLEISDLVAEKQPGPPEAEDIDASALGSLLAYVGEPVHADTAADALGITLPQLTELANALDQQLQTVGLRLHRGDTGFALVPAAAPQDTRQLAELIRGQHARHGLDRTEAQMLANALAGQLDLGDITEGPRGASAFLGRGHRRCRPTRRGPRRAPPRPLAMARVVRARTWGASRVLLAPCGRGPGFAR